MKNLLNAKCFLALSLLVLAVLSKNNNFCGPHCLLCNISRRTCEIAYEGYFMNQKDYRIEPCPVFCEKCHSPESTHHGDPGTFVDWSSEGDKMWNYCYKLKPGYYRQISGEVASCADNPSNKANCHKCEGL